MKVGDVITQVRNIVQDTGDNPRYSNDMLMGYVNMAVQSISVARPDFFACIEWVGCMDNTVALCAPSNSIRIIEVNYSRKVRKIDALEPGHIYTEEQLSEPIDGMPMADMYGPVINELDIGQLDRSNPMWRGQRTGMPSQYARNVRNPNLIYLDTTVKTEEKYRIAVEMEYACSPSTLTTLDGDIELLPESYFPIVVDGTIFLVEAMEDEAVNSRRAEVFLNKFNAALGITASSRILTDTIRAGLPEGAVVNLNVGDRTN
ncbi:MAG: hypothetical protein K0U66_04815 [Gammaproteobacteria bacterium]|nr:hypothetical protein [Gammaproteobacteria bacterium]